jgi:alpha-tubulin suppressor-like RCC1 family protein
MICPLAPTLNPSRVRLLTRWITPLLVPAVLVAALGCAEDATAPTPPEPEPALAVSSAAALTFRMVAAGGWHTCGVATDNRAYCWGDGDFGKVGDGSGMDRLTPVAVAGGISFRQVTAGNAHSCGLTAEKRAYCWGFNAYGQLGNGTNTGPETCDFLPCSTKPVAVVDPV